MSSGFATHYYWVIPNEWISGNDSEIGEVMAQLERHLRLAEFPGWPRPTVRGAIVVINGVAAQLHISDEHYYWWFKRVDSVDASPIPDRRIYFHSHRLLHFLPTPPPPPPHSPAISYSEDELEVGRGERLLRYFDALMAGRAPSRPESTVSQGFREMQRAMGLDVPAAAAAAAPEEDVMIVEEDDALVVAAAAAAEVIDLTAEEPALIDLTVEEEEEAGEYLGAGVDEDEIVLPLVMTRGEYLRNLPRWIATIERNR